MQKNSAEAPLYFPVTEDKGIHQSSIILFNQLNGLHSSLYTLHMQVCMRLYSETMP